MGVLTPEDGDDRLAAPVRVRRHVKAALGRAAYRSGMHAAAWRDRAVIALFHRVDDRYPSDPITCTRAQFTAFCDFFARYFIALTITKTPPAMKKLKSQNTTVCSCIKPPVTVVPESIRAGGGEKCFIDRVKQFARRRVLITPFRRNCRPPDDERDSRAAARRAVSGRRR